MSQQLQQFGGMDIVERFLVPNWNERTFWNKIVLQYGMGGYVGIFFFQLGMILLDVAVLEQSRRPIWNDGGYIGMTNIYGYFVVYNCGRT